MGQKLSSKLLFRSSPNTDGLYTVAYFLGHPVYTQLDIMNDTLNFIRGYRGGSHTAVQA